MKGAIVDIQGVVTEGLEALAKMYLARQ